MGIDFIRDAAPTFQKGWDRNRLALCNDGLFSREPALLARRWLATPHDGHVFSLQDEYCGELSGTELRLYRSERLVGRVVGLTVDVQNRVRIDGAGVATVRVEVVHPYSGIADVSLS